MVGFVYNPTTKEELEEEGNLNQPLALKKSNDPLDLEEFSLAFVDSLLDIDDWIEEKTDPSMADLKPDEVGKVEALDKSMEIGEEGPLKETSIGDESGEIGNLGSLIEEELGKVTLEGEIVAISGNDEALDVVRDGVKSNEVMNVDGNGPENGVAKKNDSESGEVVSDGDESDEDSESESASSSSSSSSSSASSSSDDDDEEEEKEEKVEEVGEVGEDMEEGEIRDFKGEEMVAWSDDEDDVGGAAVREPIRSKNELQVLPPVPPVNVSIQPHQKTIPVGVVLSIIGAQVIVEGVEKHNPLSEGSILWITESRSPLGIIDEIFGPVKNPYYVVRYNSDSEVPTGIHQGSLISFVPEFADFVLNNNNLYKKGYDASNENDEELSDELEFSDDEKEAEYKRMLKMSKRGMNEQKNGNAKKDKKKFKNRGGNWKNDQQPLPTSQAPQDMGQLPQNHANSSLPFGSIHGFPSGPGLGPTCPPVQQAPNFTAPSSGVWTNGIPCLQPQNMGFPNVFPANIPWTQQNFPQQPYQMLLPNSGPLHQQFGTSQMLPTNFVLQGGQPNFCAGPAFAPWPATMGQTGFIQSQGPTGLQGSLARPPMNVLPQGVVSNGLEMEQSSGMTPAFIPTNGEASRNFDQGAGYSDRGRRSNRRGGGRFRGGRGGQRPSAAAAKGRLGSC